MDPADSAQVHDEATRTRTTTARDERIGPGGTEVAYREWVVHRQHATGFRALCAAAGIEVTDPADDVTARPADGASTAFTAPLRHART